MDKEHAPKNKVKASKEQFYRKKVHFEPLVHLLLWELMAKTLPAF